MQKNGREYREWAEISKDNLQLWKVRTGYDSGGERLSGNTEHRCREWSSLKFQKLLQGERTTHTVQGRRQVWEAETV